MTTGSHAARIEALIEAMTLEEKLGQMTLMTAGFAITGPKSATYGIDAVRAGRLGAISQLWGERAREVQRIAVEESRLGIPLLFACDVIHGHRTIYPIPLGEMAAFDPDLWERTARASAVDAAAAGLALNFAPMLDIARDPRWGRIAESPGEDPWLAQRYARAKVRGFQGDDLSRPDSVGATAKHFAGYGAVQAGREYAPVDISERTFREIYLPPFKAAVEAGVASIMPAFTDLGGDPMTASVRILKELLRERWGFEGMLVSDYNAITELVNHGIAEDVAEAAALALRAGVDLDLMGEAYLAGLPVALERGSITIAEIDRSVRRILTLKARLGLLDDPFGRMRELAPEEIQAHRALAREAAQRAMVLLTNRNGVLPLKDPPRIGVIGPLADAPAEMRGPWTLAGRGEDMVPFVEGLRAAFPNSEVLHAAGVDFQAETPADIEDAVALARLADVVVLCLGEAMRMSGEAASRARPDLPGRQPELARAVLDLGKPVVVVLSSGRPLMAPWLFERADAVLATWFLGCEAGHALGDVLSGAVSPSGRLPVSWPVEVGQVPIFYARKPTGRPPDPKVPFSAKYIDLPVEPLFPFGHGLGYTDFTFARLRVSAPALGAGESITVELDVTNTGARPGEETVLLFVHDPVASVSRPLLELRGMAKVVLDAGATGTARFELSSDDLVFLGPDLEPRLEPGRIELLVGPSADRARLSRIEIQLLG